MADIKRFLKLKERVEESQREASQAEGALGEKMKQLKEQFGCDTLEEAIEIQKKLQKELKQTEQEFETAMQEFEEKWKNEFANS